MNLGWKVAIGAGIVGVGALALAACGGPKEQDAESKLLEDFQKFDRSPRDNNWTQPETTLFEVGRPYSANRYNTYRVGDMQFWEQQIVHRESTSDMDRLFAAAKGNDAVASLAELKTVAMRFDNDGNGTLNRDERKDFDRQFGASERSRTILDRVETGWSYVQDYPDPNYPGNGGGQTSPGDDGGSYNPGNGGGNTSPGDDGGGYTPPSNGGGNTSPGDSGGSSPTPPSNGGSNNGNSTDNGNPDEGDF
ncbi:MAG: hypothetical protein JWL76_443 [Thermoleophilia bacterium]|nr:hypothetical protein [Thermoleophilia bacterium]